MRKRVEAIIERTVSNKRYIYVYETKSLVRLDECGDALWGVLDRFNSLEDLVSLAARNPSVLWPSGLNASLERIGAFWGVGLLDLNSSDLVHLNSYRHQDPVFPSEKSQNNESSQDAPWVSIWNDAAEAGQILRCHIELTYRCNFSCHHCYNPRKPSAELRADELKDVLLQLKDMGCLFLTFTGGEPFIRDDFLDILQFAHSTGFVISINTNGSLLTSEISAVLAESDLLTVDIGVYGLSPRTYANFTGNPNSYARVLSGIRLLRDYDVPIFLKYIPTRHNYEDVFNFREFIKKLRVRGIIHLPKLFPRQDGDDFPLRLRITDEQYRDLFERGILDLPSVRERCYAATARTRLSPDGKLYPCEFLQIELGDLFRHRLSDIWTSNPVSQKFQEPKIFLPDECRGCKVRNFCLRCPAMSFAEHGLLTKPSLEACRVARIARQVGQARRVITSESSPSC